MIISIHIQYQNIRRVQQVHSSFPLDLSSICEKFTVRLPCLGPLHHRQPNGRVSSLRWCFMPLPLPVAIRAHIRFHKPRTTRRDGDVRVCVRMRVRIRIPFQLPCKHRSKRHLAHLRRMVHRPAPSRSPLLAGAHRFDKLHHQRSYLTSRPACPPETCVKATRRASTSNRFLSTRR